jgi:hypothetical protein
MKAEFSRKRNSPTNPTKIPYGNIRPLLSGPQTDTNESKSHPSLPSESYLQAKKKQKRSNSQRRSAQGSPTGKNPFPLESHKTEPNQTPREPFDITQTSEFQDLYDKGMQDSEIEDALKSTLNELEPINPRDLKEMLTFKNPPPLVVVVARSVALILEPIKVYEKIGGKKGVNWWATCQGMMKERGFLGDLKNFNNE